MNSGLRAMLLWAFAYWCAAALSVLVSPPPLPVGSAFVAAGVGMVGVLAAGRWGIAAVWLGAVTFELTVLAPEYDDFLTPARGLVLPLALTLEALMGAWLVRSIVGWPVPAVHSKSSFRFVPVALAAALVPATAWIAALFLLDGLPTNPAVVWTYWWLAHATGIVIGFPLAALIQTSTKVWQGKRLAMGLPLAGLFILLSGASYLANRSGENDIRHRFEHEATYIAGAIQHRLEDAARLTRTLQLFAAQRSGFTAEEFDVFARPWFGEVPYVLATGIGYLAGETARFPARQVPHTRSDAGADWIVEHSFAVLQISRQADPALTQPDPADEEGAHAALGRAILDRSAATSRTTEVSPDGARLFVVERLPPANDPPILAPALPRPYAVYAVVWTEALLASVPDQLSGCLSKTGGYQAIRLAGGGDCTDEPAKNEQLAASYHWRAADTDWQLDVLAQDDYSAHQRDQRVLLVGSASWAIATLILMMAYEVTSREMRVARLADARAVEFRALESRYLDVLDRAEVMTLELDREGRVVSCNSALCRCCGWTQDELVGQDWYRLTRMDEGDEAGRERFVEQLQAPEQTRREHSLVSRSGERRLISCYGEQRLVDGEPNGITLIGADVTELRDQQQRLAHLAHFDSLTRLPNRVLFADRLSVAIEQARRRGHRLVVAYLDLDGFKEVNDRHGHQMGDRALSEVAARLAHCLRGEDTVARLGGDEFALLITQVDSTDGWVSVIDRVLFSVAEPIVLDSHRFTISASIGITVFPDDDAAPEVLLRHADQAMYSAKQAGRNCWQLFDSALDRQARVERAELTRIEQALRDGEFELHYQPQVDLKTGMAIGAEALIRWNHPIGGLLAPARFLSVLDNKPLAVEVARWVLASAAEQVAEWRAQGIDVRVSINLAPEHLKSANLVLELQALIQRLPGFDPHWLYLEILETAALDDVSHVSATLAECTQLGVDFVIDDFGTGYSSFTFFRHLPAKTLKIDQSFVRDMLVDAEALAIVEGVLGLARVFDRRVVAEGVETLEHGARLRELGCDYAQGYAIARPMPAAEFAPWWEGWNRNSNWVKSLAAERARPGSVREPPV